MVQVIPQPTPNPQAYKFTLEGHAFDSPQTIGDAGAAAGTPFQGLFLLPGVLSVFATSNFVTVTKDPGADWAEIVEPARQLLERSF